MTENQINDFIRKHNVKGELEKYFNSVLKANSAEDLDIKDKKIFIDAQQIKYKKTDFNYHSFETSIMNNRDIIGLFALVLDDEAQFIDEFFIIY